MVAVLRGLVSFRSASNCRRYEPESIFTIRLRRLSPKSARWRRSAISAEYGSVTPAVAGAGGRSKQRARTRWRWSTTPQIDGQYRREFLFPDPTKFSQEFLCASEQRLLFPEHFAKLRIPAMMNAHSGHRDHRFRSSRSLIGAKRRGQRLS